MSKTTKKSADEPSSPVAFSAYIIYLDEVRYRILCDGGLHVLRRELWREEPSANYRYAVKIVPMGRFAKIRKG